MGIITQALVQERLFVGAERVPVILLLVCCALGVVIDMDIGLGEVLIAGSVFAWGMWVLRSCGAYDPRLFQNLAPKLADYLGLWAVHRSKLGRWSLPASPSYLRQGPYHLRARAHPGSGARP